MRKIFDNWFYNFSSWVGYLFWINIMFCFIALITYLEIGFWFYSIYMFFYVLFIIPIFVAKARDIFLKEMDLYVDDE